MGNTKSLPVKSEKTVKSYIRRRFGVQCDKLDESLVKLLEEDFTENSTKRKQQNNERKRKQSIVLRLRKKLGQRSDESKSEESIALLAEDDTDNFAYHNEAFCDDVESCERDVVHVENIETTPCKPMVLHARKVENEGETKDKDFTISPNLDSKNDEIASKWANLKFEAGQGDGQHEVMVEDPSNIQFPADELVETDKEEKKTIEHADQGTTEVPDKIQPNDVKDQTVEEDKKTPEDSDAETTEAIQIQFPTDEIVETDDEEEKTIEHADTGTTEVPDKIQPNVENDETVEEDKKTTEDSDAETTEANQIQLPADEIVETDEQENKTIEHADTGTTEVPDKIQPNDETVGTVEEDKKTPEDSDAEATEANQIQLPIDEKDEFVEEDKKIPESSDAETTEVPFQIKLSTDDKDERVETAEEKKMVERNTETTVVEENMNNCSVENAPTPIYNSDNSKTGYRTEKDMNEYDEEEAADNDEYAMTYKDEHERKRVEFIASVWDKLLIQPGKENETVELIVFPKMKQRLNCYPVTEENDEDPEKEDEDTIVGKVMEKAVERNEDETTTVDGDKLEIANQEHSQDSASLQPDESAEKVTDSQVVPFHITAVKKYGGISHIQQIKKENALQLKRLKDIKASSVIRKISETRKSPRKVAEVASTIAKNEAIKKSESLLSFEAHEMEANEEEDFGPSTSQPDDDALNNENGIEDAIYEKKYAPMQSSESSKTPKTYQAVPFQITPLKKYGSISQMEKVKKENAIRLKRLRNVTASSTFRETVKQKSPRKAMMSAASISEKNAAENKDYGPSTSQQCNDDLGPEDDEDQGEKEFSDEETKSERKLQAYEHSEIVKEPGAMPFHITSVNTLESISYLEKIVRENDIQLKLLRSEKARRDAQKSFDVKQSPRKCLKSSVNITSHEATEDPEKARSFADYDKNAAENQKYGSYTSQPYYGAFQNDAYSCEGDNSGDQEADETRHERKLPKADDPGLIPFHITPLKKYGGLSHMEQIKKENAIRLKRLRNVKASSTVQRSMKVKQSPRKVAVSAENVSRRISESPERAKSFAVYQKNAAENQDYGPSYDEKGNEFGHDEFDQVGDEFQDNESMSQSFLPMSNATEFDEDDKMPRAMNPFTILPRIQYQRYVEEEGNEPMDFSPKNEEDCPNSLAAWKTSARNYNYNEYAAGNSKEIKYGSVQHFNQMKKQNSMQQKRLNNVSNKIDSWKPESMRNIPVSQKSMQYGSVDHFRKIKEDNARRNQKLTKVKSKLETWNEANQGSINSIQRKDDWRPVVNPKEFGSVAHYHQSKMKYQKQSKCLNQVKSKISTWQPKEKMTALRMPRQVVPANNEHVKSLKMSIRNATSKINSRREMTKTDKGQAPSWSRYMTPSTNVNQNAIIRCLERKKQIAKMEYQKEFRSFNLPPGTPRPTNNMGINLMRRKPAQCCRLGMVTRAEVRRMD
ncbi:uncharacterized protein LOC128205974 [Mya arenaria]|uniref:uncharacterized protein LOC128205974 n=1 Tax=Mya arenaria TaxID=6604 RepID=UPI0022E1DA45|nr:uncharacterized protein LOC128205974 [Mya arenaria]